MSTVATPQGRSRRSGGSLFLGRAAKEPGIVPVTDHSTETDLVYVCLGYMTSEIRMVSLD